MKWVRVFSACSLRRFKFAVVLNDIIVFRNFMTTCKLANFANCCCKKHSVFFFFFKLYF